jgi:lambda family phage portal protein
MANLFASIADEVSQPRQRARSGFRASSGWAGGAIDRTTEDWTPWTLSPDFETRSAIRIMRARARQLVRDNGYCSGFIKSVSDNVIGPNGIMLQAAVKSLDGKLARATNQSIEKKFLEWGLPETASADGVDSWVDLQRLFMETMAMDGEVILRRLRGFDNPFGYTLQIIDSDLLDETFNVPAGPNQNEIRMGVEVDAYRRPLAYHLWTRYPTDQTGKEYRRERVPARDIIHRFVRYRANQARGITWFAPVMIAMHHLGHYQLNEVIASRAAAGKMGFILNKSDKAIEGWDWDAKKTRSMEIEPGIIEELMPGQEFAQFDPSHPATTYDMFETAMLRSVGRGLNTSQLTLTGDLRQANYSSMRAGLTPERDHWRALQIFAAMHCHRPVYRDWVSMSLLSGELKVDTRLASDYYEVVWKGRGWQWVDPLKDLQALKLGMDLGVDSRQHAAAEIGRDYEDVVDELAYEEEYAEEAGIDVSGNQVAGINPLRVSPEGQADDAGQPHESGDTTEPTPAAPTRGARARFAAIARHNFAARRLPVGAGGTS